MKMLDRKMVRDLMRIWAQVLAVALVMACGVMTIVLAVGAYRSLYETREAYYDRYRFGHVFASATRVPENLAPVIRGLDGVAAAETRIVEPIMLDITGMAEPASGIALSVPDFGEPAVNRLYLRGGRMPDPARPEEAAVDERFAKAHHFAPGSRFHAIFNGKRRELTITGVLLSPEYIYTIGPGDLMPDDRRFGVIYLTRTAMSGLSDMHGAFNSVSLRLMHGASESAVIGRLDGLLERFGGTGAFGRAEQTSHAFLDSELTQLNAMARVLPPVFLFVSAFLVNMILSRMVSLEREQIGLLKACGYSSAQIAWHYSKLVGVVTAAGIVTGSIAGRYLGEATTRMYAEFFYFPFLIFRESGDLYLIAAAISLIAGLAGAFGAIWSVVSLPPAVAMQPPAPMRYRSWFSAAGRRGRFFSNLTTMALRHMVRRPVRAGLSILGVSLSVALLVTASSTLDSMDVMIDTVFFRAERSDARLSFSGDKGAAALDAVRRLPGVMRAEPFRAVPVVLRNGPLAKRIAITAKPRHPELSRLLDTDNRPMDLPEDGLVLTDRLAAHLGLRPGDLADVELVLQAHRIVRVPVTAVVQSYIGLGAHMALPALDRLTGTGARISGAALDIDEREIGSLYAAVKATPSAGSISLQGLSLQRFRDTISENISIMTTIYVSLSVIIIFGVMYNAARIQFSERARELASLRVLGFTKSETASVLFSELALIALLAQPLGWMIGYGFAYAMVAGFASDLFRIPFAIEPASFAGASLVGLGAALLSAIIVLRRVNGLDMIKVLKTRE